MSATWTVREPAEDSNATRLADRLVRRLGVEDALRTCRENAWYGVLRIIQGRRNDGTEF